MSYRDVRNVTEMLRALGYTNIISMESFRTPNFNLLADLLMWLAQRFDPDTYISQAIKTEEERVNFIRGIAHFMVIKANIKLNTKRLYQADGYCVKELLKITTLLYDALQENFKPSNSEDETNDVCNLNVSDKINELKQSKRLASEITFTGARLYDLLGKEADIRSLRHMSTNRQYEANEVEIGVKDVIEEIKKEIAETKQLIDNVSATESSLDSKIERRKLEIDRYEKRLQTLKKVRPAFLEEFMELEGELEKLFTQYTFRVRVLNHLESLASDAEKTPLGLQQLANFQRVAESYPADRGNLADLLSFDEHAPKSIQQEAKQERPRARTGSRSQTARKSKPIGELNPLDSFSGSEGDMSTDTDTDDILFDGEEPELPLHSDDDSLGMELSVLERTGPSGRKTSSKVHSNSDDDF